MEVVLIGNGNVAALWAVWLPQCGHHILQVYGRTRSHLDAFIQDYRLADTILTVDVNEIRQNADLYILALPDKDIAAVAMKLPFRPQALIHCAGSVSKEVLAAITDNYGVVWPLFSVAKNNLPTRESHLPMVYDGSNEKMKSFLEQLVLALTGHPFYADDTQRLYYHLCAVLTNNFMTHLGAVTENICNSAGISMEALYPIMKQTFRNLLDKNIGSRQTGPAARNDEATMKKHLALLSDEPYLQHVYVALSDSIRQLNLKQSTKDG